MSGKFGFYVNLACGLLVVLFLPLGGLAHASTYRFESPEAGEVANQIELSLLEQNLGQSNPTGDWGIVRINERFRGLERDRIPADDLVELKYLLQGWRNHAATFLMREAMEAQNLGKFQNAVSHLRELKIRLKRSELLALESRWPNDAGLLSLMAEQGDPFLSRQFLTGNEDPILAVRGGPRIELPIQPIRDSGLKFEDWSNSVEFGRYEFKGEGVYYKGNQLLPGDLLLADLREDAPGLYSFFGLPRTYLTHFAFFAIVGSGRNRLPVAIEVYEHGVRAVPLSVFLSPEFTSYVEIYRLKSIAPDWRTKIEPAVRKIWEEPHAYDFTGSEKDRKYLSCATVGSLILERTEESPFEPRSIINPADLPNLRRLGFSMDRFLTPTDYLTDPRVSFVGWFDNHQTYRDFVTHLVLRRVQNLFETQDLNMHRLPAKFSINRWGIEQILAGTFLGRIFRWMNGFNEENFPKGPTDVLAIVEVFEAAVAEVIGGSLRSEVVLSELRDDEFSIHALESDPSVSGSIDRLMGGLSSWFVPRREARIDVSH